jgi:hypothetical protein
LSDDLDAKIVGFDVLGKLQASRLIGQADRAADRELIE